MLTKKKKVIILATMLVLLVITGYLNVVLNNGTLGVGGNSITTGNFFTTYRTDRQYTRDQEIAYYDAIITSVNSSASAKATAEERKLALVEMMETELVTEGLIKAKGFEDVIVTSTTSSINVVVKSAQLTASQVAQIVNIIQTQTGIALDYIHIIPIE